VVFGAGLPPNVKLTRRADSVSRTAPGAYTPARSGAAPGSAELSFATVARGRALPGRAAPHSGHTSRMFVLTGNDLLSPLGPTYLRR
jgi:hypothetical protein